MALKYPSRLSRAGRARIDRALTKTELRCIAISQEPEDPSPPAQPGDMVIFFDVGGKKSADPAVLQGVLDVGKVIVQVLSEEARATAWSADAMRAACDRLLEGVSRHLYSRHHSRAPGYQAFQAEWHDELKTRSWWLTFLRALLRRTRPQRAISIGHQLQQLRREAGWSIDELVNQVGLVRSSVYDHLRDTKTPHEDNLKQYEKQFSARLGRPIVIERPRRRREKRTKTD